MRKQLDLTASATMMIIEMSEGNPGGAMVLSQLITRAPQAILFLDDMNIRGSQIWVGYKDHCGMDIDLFIEKIKNRDQEMIDTINKNTGIEEQAVRKVASMRSRA